MNHSKSRPEKNPKISDTEKEDPLVSKVYLDSATPLEYVNSIAGNKGLLYVVNDVICCIPFGTIVRPVNDNDISDKSGYTHCISQSESTDNYIVVNEFYSKTEEIPVINHMEISKKILKANTTVIPAITGISTQLIEDINVTVPQNYVVKLMEGTKLQLEKDLTKKFILAETSRFRIVQKQDILDNVKYNPAEIEPKINFRLEIKKDNLCLMGIINSRQNQSQIFSNQTHRFHVIWKAVRILDSYMQFYYQIDDLKKMTLDRIKILVDIMSPSLAKKYAIHVIMNSSYLSHNMISKDSSEESLTLDKKELISYLETNLEVFYG